MNRFKPNHIISVILVAISFGTAWAIRGQFGHEQGAAWAAAIGGLALVLASGRTDWLQRTMSVTFASAIGWGMGGMISYGQVVGYGRADNLLNAGYGLLMLFVIGGLFGLIGGGLTGLSLESTNEKKVNWGRLMAEMVAGALITYGFLVMQLEILMTPPRSEAWAFCLGAGLAMLWYMARNGFNSSLRVAFYTMLGGGFGFAFGNFLQVTGNILEINFNMWNVMEYSIGFFGGGTLAYSVFTSQWPVITEKPKPWENRVNYIVVFILIPFIVFNESLTFGKLEERLGNSGIDANTALISSIVSFFVVLVMAVYAVFKIESRHFDLKGKTASGLYLVVFSAYIIVSFLVAGALGGQFHSNHFLYLLNLLGAIVLMYRVSNPFVFNTEYDLTIGKKHWFFLVTVLVVIVLLAFVLINMHGEIGGSRYRFE